MFTSVISSAVVAAQPLAHWGGPPFWPFFIFFPLMFVLIVGLIIALVARRRRFGAYGLPWAQGRDGWGGGPVAPGRRVRGAEQILAERFARGEIEEAEYRARLEVLRADRPEV